MGLMDKARAAATDLAAKADTALANSGMGGPGARSGGDADRYFRDLGVLAYLEANGRPAPAEERERVMVALRGMEAQGAIADFALQTPAPPPPGGVVPPPPGGVVPSAPAEPQTAPSAAPTAAAPPPPPSWMTKDDDRNG